MAGVNDKMAQPVPFHKTGSVWSRKKPLPIMEAAKIAL
jgi:hypothetical protein